MLIVTTEQIAGQRVVATIGLLFGIAVRRRGLGGTIMVGLHALGNGEALDEYRADLAAVREEAVAQLTECAVARGVNAVVGVRFHAAEIGHELSEIVAYGTAVQLEPGE